MLYAFTEQEAPRVGLIDTSTITIFCSILGFLLVFRTGQAYTRFWEGASLAVQIRGEWYQAISSIFAFCSRKPELKQEVSSLQGLIVRLTSLLYAAALQRVTTMDDGHFDVIDPVGIDPDSLELLASQKLKCETIMQWLQQTIVKGIDSRVIDIPPPISSRVFQELSRGMVALNDAEKISTLPFPLPYAQLVWLMLCLFSVVWPIVCAGYTDVLRCGIYTFLCTLVYWGIHFIAVELEMPFGDDANDLPVREFQEDMNQRLEALLAFRGHRGVHLVGGRRERRTETRTSCRISAAVLEVACSEAESEEDVVAGDDDGTASIRTTLPEALRANRAWHARTSASSCPAEANAGRPPELEPTAMASRQPATLGPRWSQRSGASAGGRQDVAPFGPVSMPLARPKPELGHSCDSPSSLAGASILLCVEGDGLGSPLSPIISEEGCSRRPSTSPAKAATRHGVSSPRARAARRPPSPRPVAEGHT